MKGHGVMPPLRGFTMQMSHGALVERVICPLCYGMILRFYMAAYRAVERSWPPLEEGGGP
jgi:hypothetical protein